jgi:hypothetical protein
MDQAENYDYTKGCKSVLRAENSRVMDRFSALLGCGLRFRGQ